MDGRRAERCRRRRVEGRQKEAHEIGRGITMVPLKLSLWDQLFIFLE